MAHFAVNEPSLSYEVRNVAEPVGTQTILSIQNVCKSFPGVRALDNVSIEVQKGTIHGIVGENGTFGKTRMMAKLTFPVGASIGPHPHDPEAEAYIILSGEATVTENGVQYKLGPGDCAFTGNGDTHAIENSGSEELVIYAIIFN